MKAQSNMGYELLTALLNYAKGILLLSGSQKEGLVTLKEFLLMVLK